MIEKFKATYKDWHIFVKHFPKTSRYTLGEKIDRLFVTTLEHMLTASLLSKENQLPFIYKASLKLDTLKFFLQVAWELKHLQTKHYVILAEHLNEVGKMLGGWKRGIESKTSSTK